MGIVRAGIATATPSRIDTQVRCNQCKSSNWILYSKIIAFHMFSAFRPEFATDFANDKKSGLSWHPAQMLKILNVNAVAKHLTENYTGPLVDPNALKSPFEYRKSKRVFIDGLVDTTKNLLNADCESTSHIRTGLDTGMGFVIGECLFVLNTHVLELWLKLRKTLFSLS